MCVEVVFGFSRTSTKRPAEEEVVIARRFEPRQPNS
jgi:hypothetical protein